MQASKIVGDELLNYREASRVLAVRVGTLYSWVHRRAIPFVRIGPRVVRFRRSDLESWIANHTVRPEESSAGQ